MGDNGLGRSVCGKLGPLLAARCAERTFARGTADGAGQYGILLAGTAIEQVTAVGAEHEGANGGHFAV
jgi:hypothetical protein